MRFKNDVEISWDKLFIIAVMIGQIIWNIAVMPQQVEAGLTTRFASKEKVDIYCTRIDQLEQKIDKLIQLVQYK